MGERPRTSPERAISGVIFIASIGRPPFGIAEHVGFWKTLGRKTAGIGAVAAPISQVLDRQIEYPAGGIGPAQALLDLKRLDVGQTAVLVTLQAHAATTRHFRRLLDRKDHHLTILANRGDEITLDGRHGARRVGRFDIENLFAFAGVGDTLVLRRDKSPALQTRDQELASALIAKYRDDVGFLFEIDEQPDRLAMAAAARQFRGLDRVEPAVGGKYQKLRS